MPRQEIDYFKTVIYKIVCRNLTIKDCYIGSTTDFRKRKYLHKCNCKKNFYKVYQFINLNGGWDNWDMIEIEKYPCMDSNEKRRRERYWMEELKAELNMRKSFTTEDETKERIKDYIEDNKEKLKIYRKAYYKEYYLKNKNS